MFLENKQVPVKDVGSCITKNCTESRGGPTGPIPAPQKKPNWGTIYVYEGTSSVTDGVPDDDDKVHLTNRKTGNGEVANNTFSGHFTVPDGYVFILKNSEIGQVRASAALFVDAEVQVMEYGKSWITKRALAGGSAGTITALDDNLIYALPNSTLKMWAHLNGSNDTNEALANFSGYLAKIIT